MSLMLVEIWTDAHKARRLADISREIGADDVRIVNGDRETAQVFALAHAEQRQLLLDRVQAELSQDQDWRIVVLPVEAAVPAPEEADEQIQARMHARLVSTREEIYNDVAHGAVLDANFMMFVALSTIVAAVGMVEDSPAVLVGAMVIAPLLGPNLAMMLATALGDAELARRSVRTNAVGIGFAMLIGAIVGLLLPINLSASELAARTEVGLASIVLALASGAAAALSLTTGIPAALVGVMVAVALLPPATAVGIMVGAGRLHDAFGALLLLSVNLAALNLAGQLVFLAKSVAPRTWLEKRAAAQSTRLRIILWASSLTVLTAVIVVRAG